ncbi:hypothetical protein [Planomonospora parontospora]|uniref:hypothetical protein n=1 Tax=Planomonospora parontospora TaxID=58119 RepID=UPI00166F94EC|nr:hypothetical protein [Planomonospora parontospora]GGL54774.1 hypothetical protein GCM10014719_65090 [Planomonospora parontospora subsp. antibiotica]GII19272.1 hypothetical protein Ppa05_59980 [Planomonospora parontospora subsp. antibiotica]
MHPPLIIPVLVTTDLPPETDLAELGRHIADAVTVLNPSASPTCSGRLDGRAFWLDRPVLPPIESDRPAPIAEQLRFAVLLGVLTAAASPETSAKDVLATARAAIKAAIITAYGDLGSPPVVIEISAEDVRERTPDDAVPAVATDSPAPPTRMLAG